MKEHQYSAISISLSLSVALSIAALCTTAHAAANFSYLNTTGGTVYEMDAPSSASIIGVPSTVLLGAGPNGFDAYYRPGNTGSGDDASQYYWDFSWTGLPDVGTDLASGLYVAQAYVSDYGALSHENDGVFGSANGAWGYHGLGTTFSSWNGVAQSTPGWTTMADWGTGAPNSVWLSNTGDVWDMTAEVKWNPWGGYGGLAVSGLRVSTDGNFTMVPEPSALALGLLGGLALLWRRAKR